MNMDKKEQIMLEHYRGLISERKFDEYDVYAFLIFIRRHIIKNSNYQYIAEFSNLIAHRGRDRGIVVNCIANAVRNGYKLKNGTREIEGYNGIGYSDYSKELYCLGQEFNLCFDDNCIKEFLICIFSITQFTEYEFDENCIGRMLLFQGKKDGKHILAMATSENNSKKDNAGCVCFSLIEIDGFKKDYFAGLITDPVQALRVDGKLRLLDSTGIIL